MEHYILEVAHTQANLAAISIAKESIKQAANMTVDENNKKISVLDRKGPDGKLTGPGPAMKKKKRSHPHRKSGSVESSSSYKPEEGTLNSMESAAQMSNYK